MRVTCAQLPPAEKSSDRIFVTPNAIIVLDGASTFVEQSISAAVYADALGRRLAALLAKDPATSLQSVLAAAIEHVAEKLVLRPGDCPTSTVSILRENDATIDVLVLGDSPVIVGTTPQPTTITDDRLARLEFAEQRTYRARLAAGDGFDDVHMSLIAQLQAKQARRRNKIGGYWIAEADPAAAHRAIIRQLRRDAVTWAVLLTDGAAHPLELLKLAHWSSVAYWANDVLLELLRNCETWEATEDPDARILPRAKRHDDKTIATATWHR